MAEGYLELTVADVCDAVEAFTGNTTAGAALVHAKAAYMRFLSALDPRTGRSHFWSFLQPHNTLTLTAVGAGTNDLPDDFGGLLEPFIYAYAADLDRPALEQVSPETIYQMWRDSSHAGTPRYYAMIAKAAGGTSVIVAPVPDVNRTVNYRYLRLATDITDSDNRFLGGLYYSYTIRALALAAAELGTGQVDGVMEAAAGPLLAASIDRDKALFTTTDNEAIHPWR